MARVYVLAEDRPDAEVGLRLALVSLFRHIRGTRAVAYWPCATPSFREWARRFAGLALVPHRPEGAWSWNCKPQALLPLLSGEFDEAIWLDSDVIVTRDPSPLFDPISPAAVVATEEPPGQPHPGSASLAAGWRMKPGRSYAVSLNSSVLRVCRHHIPLLQRWQQCLCDPGYVEAQQRPFSERPHHLMSDQDVLLALLGSEEFSRFPLHYLRGGREIIHCGGALGYGVAMRFDGLRRRVPTFLHAIAGKPWWVLTPVYRRVHSRWFTFYRRLLQETSPYVREAARYRAELGLDCPWLDYRSPLGSGLRLLGFGHFALRGLPLTVAAEAIMGLRSMSLGHPSRYSPSSSKARSGSTSKSRVAAGHVTPARSPD
jgi:hypothetical protein